MWTSHRGEVAIHCRTAAATAMQPVSARRARREGDRRQSGGCVPRSAWDGGEASGEEYTRPQGPAAQCSPPSARRRARGITVLRGSSRLWHRIRQAWTHVTADGLSFLADGSVFASTLRVRPGDYAKPPDLHRARTSTDAVREDDMLSGFDVVLIRDHRTPWRRPVDVASAIPALPHRIPGGPRTETRSTWPPRPGDTIFLIR
jgi:hypothetical protein